MDEAPIDEDIARSSRQKRFWFNQLIRTSVTSYTITTTMSTVTSYNFVGTTITNTVNLIMNPAFGAGLVCVPTGYVFCPAGRK